MFSACQGPHCQTPPWMRHTLIIAGAYHLLFGIHAFAWPCLLFEKVGISPPNIPLLWRIIGGVSILFGAGFLIAARKPFKHWPVVLLGWAKFTLVVFLMLSALIAKELPVQALWVMGVDDLLWWLPFSVILWQSLQWHSGRALKGLPLLTPAQAADKYTLSSGESLTEAAREQTLALVFLRHFGCTFTRQILRELEKLKAEADRHGARLVLVHMLRPGAELGYISPKEGVARIADPQCELYRAFGLGKGGFIELFGPRVWLPTLSALIRGCGMGHLAGDGLQMPGAFLFRDGRIISTQRPISQAFLPDLVGLFAELNEPVASEKVSA